MNGEYGKLMRCYESFRKKIDFKPRVAPSLHAYHRNSTQSTEDELSCMSRHGGHRKLFYFMVRKFGLHLYGIRKIPKTGAQYNCLGPNIEELGTRFPDMSTVYDRELQEILRQTAKEYGIPLKEGVYVQFTGPSFESPAEIAAWAVPHPR